MMETTRKRFEKVMANGKNNECKISQRLLQMLINELDSQIPHILEVEKELNNFKDAVEFCRGTKRSTTSSDGWTLICKDYYSDLICEIESLKSELKHTKEYEYG